MEERSDKDRQVIPTETGRKELESERLQTEQAKAAVEMARISAEVQSGWQKTVETIADKIEHYSAHKVSGETRYTTTLTIGVLVFLAIIVVALFVLTLRGQIGGEPLVFFLGTLTGSVLMLVAERIKSQK